jgi:glyoxylase-like metal-dependent hydrolase (beta-lactamase superfamily II)
VENAYGVRSLPLKTPTLPPATHTNLYRVGPVSPLLLDPGSPYANEIDAAVAAVDRWRSDCGPPQAIFLTHHHIDHVSGAESLRARLGLPVWAHRETAARVKFEVDREIEDGERLGDWTAIHTPGHAPGHLCLWNSKTRQLVAGDMVASIGTIVVEPIDGDMSQYLASLRLLRELPAIVAYPAHGAMIDDPSGRFDAYLSHRLWREERIVAALLEGEATSAELTSRAYTDVNPAIHWLAEQQALAHLLKLQAEGRASLANDLWSLRPAQRP